MINNYRSFLRNLPLNTDLMREFLTQHRIEVPVDWAADEHILATELADSIEAYADSEVRDEVIATIEQIAQLADKSGARQMLSVCDDPAIVTTFETLGSPEERALWLYVHKPQVFDEATLARFFDDGLMQDSSQRWELPACPDLNMSSSDQNAIAEAVAGFYQHRFGYGRHFKVFVLQRHIEKSVLLVIDLSDHATNRAVWTGGRLRRGSLTLSRTLALNYHPETGRTETVAPGGAEAQRVFVDAFAVHGLKRRNVARRIVRETYELDVLLNGLTNSDPASSGIRKPRLKVISVLDKVTGLRSTFEVTGRNNAASAEMLLKDAYPSDKPLNRLWQVVGAQIELPFYPGQGHGGTIKKTLTLRFNSKGQTNLHKFTQEERSQIEPLLVEWGLVAGDERRPAAFTEDGQ